MGEEPTRAENMTQTQAKTIEESTLYAWNNIRFKFFGDARMGVTAVVMETAMQGPDGYNWCPRAVLIASDLLEPELRLVLDKVDVQLPLETVLPLWSYLLAETELAYAIVAPELHLKPLIDYVVKSDTGAWRHMTIEMHGNPMAVIWTKPRGLHYSDYAEFIDAVVGRIGEKCMGPFIREMLNELADRFRWG